MKRAALKETLELVSLALSDQPMIPIFQCFCFDGTIITAYDDAIGIVARCPDGNHTFAVHGKTFLGLISSSRAEDLEWFAPKDNSITIRADRSTFKLPYFPEKDFLFKTPEGKWLAELPLNKSFLDSLEACLTTVSKDEAQPALMGVELCPGELFSCDGDAVTRARFKALMSEPCSCMLPSRFCSVLLKVVNTTEWDEGLLSFNDQWVMAELDNDYTVYGRLLQNDNPIDLEALIEKFTKGKDLPFVAVPEGLKESLARAQIIENIETAPTRFTIESNRLKLVTDARAGEVRDSLSVAKHPDIEANLSASLVLRTISLCDEICLYDNCLIGRHGDELFQVVSTMDSK